MNHLTSPYILFSKVFISPTCLGAAQSGQVMSPQNSYAETLNSQYQHMVFYCITLMYLCVCAHRHNVHVEVRKQLDGFRALFPSCESWELNSDLVAGSAFTH